MKAVARRLPGIRFETKSPPLAETLPRMDVALFVGFAASGPLQTPVAVEDIAQFTMIFGDEVTLAWDEQAGETLKAYLAPAVKAFFRNGGRRCWVVRVASEAAASNYFPIAGLAYFDGVTITPAFAQARSRGSWSDVLEVSASLTARSLLMTPLSLTDMRFALTLAAPDEVVVGDLLRLTFRGGTASSPGQAGPSPTSAEGYILFCTVKAIEAGAGLPSPLGGDSAQVVITGENGLWFALPTLSSLAVAASGAATFPHFGGGAVTVAVGDAPLVVTDEQAIRRVTLELALALEDAPALGSLLQVEVDGEQLWLAVQEVRAKTGEASLVDERIEVTGEGFFWLPTSPSPLPIEPSICEKLTFELAVRRAGDYPQRLGELAFAPKHPQFWDALPTDEQLYAGDEVGRIIRREFPSRADFGDLWQAVTTPRFPLAGVGVASGCFFPVALPILGDVWLGADRPPGDGLERDGLAEFGASLFLDAEMIGSGLNTLIEQADFIRYRNVGEIGANGRNLVGIHAAIGVEEATIIAVPDAVHCGWQAVLTGAPPPPDPIQPFTRPEWWTFLPCDWPPNYPIASEPLWGNFLDCGLRVLDAPVLTASATITERGTYLVEWTQVAGNDVTYVLEESSRPDYGDAQVIFRGTTLAFAINGRGFGDYYYRVRAVVNVEGVEEATSDWSNGVVVRVAPLRRWIANTVDACESVQPQALLAVQRALLRMCAARGDLLAVLALPEHYREDEAIQHMASLRSPLTQGQEIALIGGSWVTPLGYGESRAFSYGALYHPWLVERVSDRPLRWLRLPPDGAACGVLAQRALNRGAWIAPANELLRDVIALSPPLKRARWLDLQIAQVNVVRQEPRGFVVMNADTLSNDADLRPINVRRLLMLLRRLALREGFRYVFEPNDEAFQRLVARSFEGMLEQMFERGAFAGATPESSFQVVTSNTINTRQSMEAGRFIVELRVAPSLPMTFLTVRLVQTHERTFVTE